MEVGKTTYVRPVQFSLHLRGGENTNGRLLPRRSRGENHPKAVGRAVWQVWLEIILWLDGTKSELIGRIGQKYDDL